jgi:Flp pilus assembly protein TadG
MARRLVLDRSGASAAEFGLVLPMLILLLLGMIDVGRYMWTINRAEKAVQMGVRMAVVTDYVSSAINANYIGACSPALKAGDSIPPGCFSTVTCSRSGTTATCSSGTASTTAFNRVLTRMEAIYPEVVPSNVEVIYSDSGVGYAGNPTGPDVAPLVTVRLSGMTFQPISLFSLASVTLPDVHSSLTFEDGTGSQSN